MACSAEKRSAGSSDTDQFLLSSIDRFKEEVPSTEICISDRENESGVSKIFGTNESSSQGQENAGSSGKRKHSRWDSTQADDLNVDDGVVTTKQRRTRWAGEDSQVKLLGPIHLPGSVRRSTDPAINRRVVKLKKQLMSVNRKLLQAQESVDELQRDDGHREKLVKEKQCLIRKLVCRTTLVRKLPILMKEYPECDFTRLILGKRGQTQRKMENETKARIMLRGKGSPKRKDAKPDPSDNEELHVRIEADSQRSLDAAVAMVERLLRSVVGGKNIRGENAFKTGEMALNDDKCEICGDAQHFAIACPFAGKFLQTGAYENNVNFPAALGGEFSAFTRPPFLRNHPLEFSSAAHSVPLGSDEFKRDVDYTNLYVSHLPQYVDECELLELFSLCGPVTYAQVIRDKTTGLSEGHGFVRYADPASAAMAVGRMNGYRLDGNVLAVCIAGTQHSTPNNSMQAVECASISFPPAYQKSYFATNHNPALPCWPGPPRPIMPETHNPTHASYGLSYSRPILPCTSAPNAAFEELARFPGYPDKYASGSTSLFS